jgi:hypothetical protein
LLNHTLLDTAPDQIVTSRRTEVSITEVVLKPGRSGPIDLLCSLRGRGLTESAWRCNNFNSDSLSEILDDFRKTFARRTLQKCKDVSPNPATETMEDLLGRTDGKRRGLILMKRASGLEALPSLRQSNMLVHNLYDIDPVPNPVNDVLRNQASAHESRSSYVPVTDDRMNQWPSNRNN